MSIRPGGPSKADLSNTYAQLSTARAVGPNRSLVGGLFPPGVKMKGVNFTPFTPADFAAYGNQAVGYQWAAFDWANWIKPQIDLAAKNGNTFRMAGTMGGLARGQLTTAQYLARWTQVLDYVASKGLWMYPGGESFNDYGGVTQAYAIDVTGQMVSLFNQYPNVFLFDMVNEAAGSGINNGLDTTVKVATYCQAMYDAIKPIAKMPLTFSAPHVGATSALWSASDVRALWAPFCEVWDIHCYHTPTLADLTPFLTDPNYKPWIIGEMGETVAAGTAAQTARMASMRTLMEHPDCMGGLVWAGTHQDVVPGNQWGVWTSLPGRNRYYDAEGKFSGTLAASGWVVDGGSSVTLSLNAASPIEGAASLLVTANAGGGGANAYRAVGPSKRCVPGETVTATVDAQQVTGAGTPTHAQLRFLTSAFATISTTLGADTTLGAGVATLATVSAVAPANAAYALAGGGFGAAGSAGGDSVQFDNIRLSGTQAPAQPEYLAGLQSLPSTTKPLLIDLALTSDQTLNGGNGTWVDATGMTTTFSIAKPCRVRARIFLDGQLVTGASQAIGGRVLVDGATVDGRTAIVGGATGAEVTASQGWPPVYLAPGTHTIKGQVVNFGSATNNVVKSAHSHLSLELEAC